MRNLFKVLGCLVIFGFMFTLVGCDSEEEGTVLRVGVALDEANPGADAANEHFIASLEEATGMRVEIIEDVSYLIAIEAMRGGNLDMYLASSFQYISASQALEVEILATLDAPGTVTYFITHADTDIYTLEDFRDRSFAFVNESSTSGFLFPAYDLIRQFDLDATQIAAPGHFFSTVVMSGAHDNSIIGVYHGDFDGAAVATILLDNLHESGIIDRNSIRVVDQTREHPAVSYIARADLGAELIETLRTFLINYENPEFFAAMDALGHPDNRFTLPDAEGYAYVRSLAYTLGIIDEK